MLGIRISGYESAYLGMGEGEYEVIRNGGFVYCPEGLLRHHLHLYIRGEIVDRYGPLYIGDAGERQVVNLMRALVFMGMEV